MNQFKGIYWWHTEEGHVRLFYTMDDADTIAAELNEKETSGKVYNACQYGCATCVTGICKV